MIMKLRPVILITVISALGGLLFGFDTAVISGTISLVREQFQMGLDLEGWFVSSALVGCVAGVAFAGVASDIWGRKRVLFASAMFFLLSSMGCALAGSASILIFFRIIGGVGIGIASILSPLYIAELSPTKLRGRLVAMYQLAITVGILSAYLSNAAIVQWFEKTGIDNWRLMFGTEAFPALLFLALLFFIPESPRWLLSKKRNQQAKSILEKYLPQQEAKAQISAAASQSEAKSDFTKILSNPKLLGLLAIGAILAALSQLSGINAIIYFGPDILTDAGLTLGASLGGQVTIGIVNVLFTLLAIWKIDAWGRKPLLLIGIIGVLLALILCGLYFTQGFDSPALLIIFITTFIAFFAFSYGPVVWIVLSEIYPTRIRGTAMSVATMALWLSNVLVAQVFPRLNAWSEGGTFFVFGGITVLAFVFVFIFIPETKQKSLEEIEQQLLN
jgi:SP family arabinose:H+ symporter-like MFS transporter